MANTLLTIDMITREALRVLHGTCAFIKGCSRQYDSSFEKTGAKIGDTLRVRLPNQYTVSTSAVMDVQNTVEQSVSLPITNRAVTSMNFSSKELALDIDDFSEIIIKPAMSVIASHIDYTALSMTYDVANSVGTPGTTPASINVWSDAMAKLDDALAPRDGNRMILATPTAMAKTMQGSAGLFNPSANISDQYRNGMMYDAVGAKWMMDQNLRNLTTGTNTNRTTTCDLAANVTTGDSTLSNRWSVRRDRDDHRRRSVHHRGLLRREPGDEAESDEPETVRCDCDFDGFGFSDHEPADQPDDLRFGIRWTPERIGASGER